MKRTMLYTIAFFLLLGTFLALAETIGTVTTTRIWRQSENVDATLRPYVDPLRGVEETVKRLDIRATVSAAGVTSATIRNLAGSRDLLFVTQLLAVATSGTAANTGYVNWDLQILDSAGLDLLKGYGADRSNSAIEGINFVTPASVVGPMRVYITSSTQGSIYPITILYR